MPFATVDANRLIRALRRTVPLALAVVFGPPSMAHGQTVGANALAEFGLVVPAGQVSFEKGGLGKLEYGGSDVSPLVTGQALADLRAQFDQKLGVYATLRLAPDQHAPFDVLEAYARYQPILSTSWVWTLKGGAFFPPISLENEGVGWTSPWTLTSSAINSWVGDELRTIGLESNIEWRYTGGAAALFGAVFGANDPAGALLADRGWVFDSRPAGLFGEPRVSDLVAGFEGRAGPLREQPFQEIDGQPGWYAGASLRKDGVGRLTALYYDNRGDPDTASGTDLTWRTQFASVGAEADIGDVVLLGQGMVGRTSFEPEDEVYSTTDFQSAYLLAGYYFGDYRVAGRADWFATQSHSAPGGPGPGEHGYALTVAGTWAPKRWLHLTAEVLRVDSVNTQRTLISAPPHAVEWQGRLAARFLY